MGIPLTILEAKWALYRQQADGEALLAFPVWTGGCVDRVRLNDEPIERETWPTGEPAPKAHHIGKRHSIELDKLWKVEGSEPFDYQLELDQKYVLVITWQEERSGLWHRRTYYGVTDKGISIEAAVDPLRPTQAIQWRAEDMIAEGGYSQRPSYAPAVKPWRLKWAGADGEFWLFNYNLTTRLFAEVQTGISTGRATVANTSDFELAIEATRACWLESGVMQCHELIEDTGIAAALDRPRVEFWRGKSDWRASARKAACGSLP